MSGGPLDGFRVGVTAARKVEEQVALLERRGARVEWGPALATDPDPVDGDTLTAATREVLAAPVDLFLATTGVGLRAWFAGAAASGLLDRLLAHLQAAEILARGPKTVGVLRRNGLRELWSPDSECFDDVLAHLRGRDLAGRRVVLQEHGQSLAMAAAALRRHGAEVVVVTSYRVQPPADPAPVFRLVERVADGRLDAVTFTSAPAVTGTMAAAASLGLRREVVGRFRDGVLAACVGPVTSEALEAFDVPVVRPERSRLAALVALLETELPRRRDGTALDVAGRRLRLHDDRVLVDGAEVRLTPGPLAVLRALAASPGRVVGRGDLLAVLPGGTAGSEHAVEMAVARLRTAVGAELVQTVVKRGYRLAVPPPSPP